MAKYPPDPQTREYQYRPGGNGFGAGVGWKGVNTEADPGSLQPNELRRGENIRLRGGRLYSRPGLRQVFDIGVNESGSAQAIRHMMEAPADNPRVRLWGSAQGCFGSTEGTGGEVFHFDTTENPSLQTYSQFRSTADRQVVIATYGDKILLGDNTALREVVRVSAPNGATFGGTVRSDISYLFGAMSTTPATVALAVFPGFVIRCAKEFDSKLFVGLENVAVPAASKIVVWNGLSVTDDLTGINPPLAFGVWRDKLVVGFGAATAAIRYRSTGAAPGSWTNVALAGMLCASQGNAMAEYGPYLYIASGTDLLHRFDGAALSLVRTIVGAAVDGNGLTGVALHKGLLYYVWNTPGAAYATRIGRHDRESTAANEYIDTYKDITTEQANFKHGSSIASSRNQIIVGGRSMWIVGTKENDVKGTLEVISNQGAPGAGFEIRQLLRVGAA